MADLSEEVTLRLQAFHYAVDTHPNRYNVNTEEKPSLGELLDRAALIEQYFSNGVVPFNADSEY